MNLTLFLFPLFVVVIEGPWTVRRLWTVLPFVRPPWLIISIIAALPIISLVTPLPVVTILYAWGRIALCENCAAPITELRSISPQAGHDPVDVGDLRAA